MKIWLDDTRDPVKFGYFGWVWIKTADECIEYCKLHWNEITDISLDHDLDIQATLGNTPTEKTGYDVVTWIEEKVLMDNWHLPNIIVHSMNPSGKKRMEQVLYKLRNK